MLNLVLPKGSLEQQTLQLFQEADLPVKRASTREYNACIDDPRIASVKILRPQEIPVYLEQGYFDLGVTGLDWIRETGSHLVEIMDLNYNKQGIGGPVKIVLAVAEESGIKRPEELRAGTRISTEYLNLADGYFKKLGIPVRILPSYGATEAKVPDIADGIIDITETGSTLARHGMRIIDIVLLSTTKLVANESAYEDPAKRAAIDELSMLLNGVLAARGKVLIKLNVPKHRLSELMAVLPAMKAPTVSELYGAEYYAIETVVVKSEINLLIPELRKRGAEDILELPITKIIV